jgi:excisionase family DNA binding protein
MLIKNSPFLSATQPLTPLTQRDQVSSQAQALIDRDQLAAAIRVSRRTIDQWRADGIIPYIKVGAVVRFDLADVLAALRERFCVRAKKTKKATV